MEKLHFSYQEKTSEDTSVLEQVDLACELIVYNDEVNTFDWVIESLIDVCKHTPEQAEQCSIIIHYKGKATVKNGVYEELDPLKNELLNRGIDASIEQVVS